MRGHLPREAGGFMGRSAELGALARMTGDSRLVTVTGPGGVGKTRLALRAAALAARTGDHPDGVWWADLSGLQGDRLLVATVSDAVDLHDHTPRMPVDALCEWLAGKRLLLVLDSCEHLVAPCADLVTGLLTAAPGLTVLVTGRQPLQVPAESVLELGPLPADGPDARALLVRRAGRRPGGPGEAHAVTELCRRLEGIPLALELAAAQVPQYGYTGVLERLDSLFDVLEGPEGTRPRRHRTLRTAVGWSHELCEPLERLLWARLAVFRGSFDADTATEVCAGGPLEPPAVAKTLAGLVAKSVVVRDDDGRHRMLDTIREYGLGWLGALGEEDAVTGRLAELCLRTVRQAGAEWHGVRQRHWYERIAASHTDLCTAWEHLQATDPPRALELAGGVGFFWACCGHLHEARGCLEHSLARTGASGPHRVRALWALGVALTLQGEYGLARARGAECAEEARRHADAEGTLDAAYLAGLIALLEGDPDAAHDLAVRALRAAPPRAAGSGAALRCRLVKLFARTGAGRFDEARAQAKALRRECVAAGEYWTRSYVHYQLALICLLTGEPEEAAGHARAMLAGKRGLGDSFGVALGLDLLAAALAAVGDGEGAAHVSGTGEAYWRSTGHPQRGMPELGGMRTACERAAREAAGDDAYDRAFWHGVSGVPAEGLARALAPDRA
ncbi:NB-ARC domain-containing protein [Streptomyces sp. NPDC005805]|uniref:ATP-binding protein n=1 Tax=Streptomyces sp. NPDC005805 TaxID=3157068 RepID=UPI0033F035DA